MVYLKLFNDILQNKYMPGVISALMNVCINRFSIYIYIYIHISIYINKIMDRIFFIKLNERLHVLEHQCHAEIRD